MSDHGFVVIVEGTDKCGKSSLAARLERILEWPVVKTNQPRTPDAGREYRGVLDAHPGPFIADRFHLGELVYGPLYRGGSTMDIFEMANLESALLRRGCLLVMMEDEPSRVQERFREHGEAFARVEDVPKLLGYFDTAWRRSALPKLRASWDIGLPVLVANVVALLERQQGLAARLGGEL